MVNTAYRQHDLVNLKSSTYTLKMGRRLPAPTVYLICRQLEAGEDPQAIASHFKIAVLTVYDYWLNLDLFGSPYAPRTVHLGCHSALTVEQKHVHCNRPYSCITDLQPHHKLAAGVWMNQGY